MSAEAPAAATAAAPAAAATPAPAAAAKPADAAAAAAAAPAAAAKDAKDTKAADAKDKPVEPPKDLKDQKKAMLTTEKEDDDKDWDADLSNYNAAPRMSVVDIMLKDKTDPSLEKYKKQLLGEAANTSKPVAAMPNDPRHCIVESISLVFAGQPPFVINPNDKTLKSKPLILKENATFKTVIRFYIQHEIVSGLRYQNKIYKHGFKVDTRADMLGSFAPQTKLYEITLPEDATPSGFIGRGAYTARCKIVDDDKTKHCAFEYAFEIKVDWK